MGVTVEQDALAVAMNNPVVGVGERVAVGINDTRDTEGLIEVVNKAFFCGQTVNRGIVRRAVTPEDY